MAHYSKDRISFNITYLLGHELMHAVQRDMGDDIFNFLAENKQGGVKYAEIQVVGFENYLRATLNEGLYAEQRKYYDGYSLKAFTTFELQDFISKMNFWKNLHNIYYLRDAYLRYDGNNPESILELRRKLKNIQVIW